MIKMKWYDNIFNELLRLGNKETGARMAAYMQNKFPFLGIQKPQLKDFMKPYLKESKKYGFDYGFVEDCWDFQYREAQYIAVEYINMNEKKLDAVDLDFLKELIVTKSWWETVDTLNGVVGSIVLKNPELKKTMLEWSTDENIWLRRSSIDFQQKYKEKTDTSLLENIIKNNLNSKEFFINKAIGWSLRNYSKTNPEWVKDFIERHRENLASLSIKEASKYL